MAVANFHYITRMSSGFKVYILEGELVYAVFVFLFIPRYWNQWRLWCRVTKALCLYVVDHII